MVETQSKTKYEKGKLNVNFLQQEGFCQEQFMHLPTTIERCDKLIKHPSSQILILASFCLC